MSKIGMVIVNFNDFEETNRLIDNVKNYKCLNKIVVVDNCSTDDSYLKLKKLNLKKIDIIKTDMNKGYAYGLNYGAKYLIDKIGDCHIIISNSDVVIKDENDIVKLSDNINNSIKVVGPTIEESGGYNRGWKMTKPYIEILSNLPLISRYFKKKFLYYKDDYYNKDISYVDVVSGCFFLIDSKILKKVDYFDDNTFLYYEEFILAHKIKLEDKKIIVDNKVHIIHDHSKTIDKSIKRVKKYKILKESQRYFAVNYLNINMVERFLLFITNKLSLLILYIRCL